MRLPFLNHSEPPFSQFLVIILLLFVAAVGGGCGCFVAAFPLQLAAS
jgi:hypothetical protein